MKRIKRVGRAVPIAAIALLLSLSGVGAVSDTLPGGSSISVDIISPPNGVVVPQGPVTVTGTASVGEGVPVADTILVYVIDLSGSTQTTVPGTLCGPQNFEAPGNQIIDCEIAAAKALNNAAIAAGTVFEIAAVGFAGTDGNLNSAVVMDLGAASGIQRRVPPDSTVSGQLALDRVLFSVADGGIIQLFSPFNVGNQTNYWAAVQRAAEVAKESTAKNKVVVFLSDGLSNVGGPGGLNVNSVLTPAIVGGITFHTFAIGNAATCTTSQANRGTLQQIAAATGGTCSQITDPQDAIDVIPGVIASSLTAVSVSVDGGPAVPATTASGLPLTGPGNVNWEFTTGALAPGSHEICATAAGTDGGGAGDVSDCVTVHVNAAPAVSATAGAGAEGSPIAISANVTDDGTPSISWSYTAGAGVDAGATCTFADASAAATAIQCTDDGSFLVTATVNDGINPAAEASAPVTVGNVNPAVDITSPAPGATFAVGAPVALTTITGDQGANDVVACSINWGDGSPTTPGCGGTHAFTAGSYTVTVTATDGDGGTAVDTVSIRVNNAPSCTSVAPSQTALWPPNNKFVPVTLGGGSDPDGDAITLAVTGITQDEPASAGGDASIGAGRVVNLRASRAGSGDGRIYEVAFTITDAHGATCSATTKVAVPHDQSGAPAIDSVVRFPSLP